MDTWDKAMREADIMLQAPAVADDTPLFFDRDVLKVDVYRPVGLVPSQAGRMAHAARPTAKGRFERAVKAVKSFLKGLA